MSENKKLTIDCIVADMRHNKFRLNPLTGANIGLPEQAILRFESTLSEEEREVRCHGKFRYLSGRVWKIWDRLIHTYDRRLWIEGEKGVIVEGQPPRHWKRTMVIDPHDEKPHAVLWVAKDPEHDILYAYREAWLANMTFKQVCEYIKDTELANREIINFRVIDPNMGAKTQGSNKLRVRDEFEKESKELRYPIRFIMADDHEALGRKKVEDLLWYDIKLPITIINRPKLLIANDLEKCIYQIEHFLWPDRDEQKPDPTIEKPVKKNDDFPALLRYLALFKWPVYDPVAYEGYGNAYE